MSITEEIAKQHKNDPAVLCCLTKEGKIITPNELEDPNIIPDLEDSGLLEIPENVLTIGQVLGAKLIKTVDALTPVTPDMVEGIQEVEANEPKEFSQNTEDTVEEEEIINSAPASGMVKIYIEKGEGIKLEFPAAVATSNVRSLPQKKTLNREIETLEDKIKRTLKIRDFTVKEVRLGDKTSFKNGVLTIREGIAEDALKVDKLVKKVEIDIISPDDKDVYTNTIMDVVPIATKAEGKIGEGITNELKGAVVILTGVDEKGIQIHEFGSCEGIIGETVCFGRPGSPDEDDIMIRVHVTIQEGTGMERRGPYAAHKACDFIIQEIREVLKKIPNTEFSTEKECLDVERVGRPRVVLVKEIMGQGAMHDNVILPKEPAGVFEGRQNVDLGNVPVMLTPNEVRDGGIHALTCIGPASKETTRFYFRDPLLKLLAEDEELNLVGVVFVGSPQINSEKKYVSERLGVLVESLNVDGAIVTTEGFGNNHIDFASHIEQIGKRNIPVVGVTYAAVQGQLVVGNKYMDAMVELDKNKDGVESEKLGENTLCKEDGIRAIAMLKAKIAGVPIKPAARKWDPEIPKKNLALIEKV